MALAMGSIMAVEAVLLSHMDRKEVVTIIPRMSLGTEGAGSRSRTEASGPSCPPPPTSYGWKVKGQTGQTSDQVETRSTHHAILYLRK